MWIFALVRPDYDHRDLGLISKLAKDIDELQVAFYDISSNEDSIAMKATFEINSAPVYFFIQDGRYFEIFHDQFVFPEKFYEAIDTVKHDDREPLPDLAEEGIVMWWQIQQMFSAKYVQFGRPLMSVIGGKTLRHSALRFWMGFLVCNTIFWTLLTFFLVSKIQKIKLEQIAARKKASTHA